MKRLKITLEEIADTSNLLIALHKASRGKHHRDSVKQFVLNLDRNLALLSQHIVLEKLPYGRFSSFQIFDPKKRTIHAACFEDRIFHHAVMNVAGDRLDKAMIFHSYACRANKGVHKAINQVQKNLQRYEWFVKIDISAYFSRINHQRLFELLSRCLKGEHFSHQLVRIIKSCPEMKNIGLPIGSLTSQYFANYYLDGLDRFLMSHQKVNANIRYMDDVIWWAESKADAKRVLKEVITYLEQERMLAVKQNVQVLPSHAGVSYCGFRILQGSIRLSRRRKKSIIYKRQYWEQQCLDSNISIKQLQMAYASIQAIAQGTNSLAWRQKQLQDKPAINV